MMKILKWEVPVDDQEHKIGCGRIVHVDHLGLDNLVCIWTEEMGEPIRERRVKVVGTGPFYDGGYWAHVGTAVHRPSNSEWHLLEWVGWNGH